MQLLRFTTSSYICKFSYFKVVSIHNPHYTAVKGMATAYFMRWYVFHFAKLNNLQPSLACK